MVRPQPYNIMSLGASLVTGLTMDQLLNNPAAISDAELAVQLQRYLTAYNKTCIVGFNNIAFDDTVLENLFFRNFINPWAWRWVNGNSRFDLCQAVIACHTLCPQVLPSWPVNPIKGTYEYKLETLGKHLGLNHEQAHDAMSDVIATANLLQVLATGDRAVALTPEQLQVATNFNSDPRTVFNHLLSFRTKDGVANFLSQNFQQRVVYFAIRNSRLTRGATPVFVLNQFAGNANFNSDLYLLNLLTPTEELESFFRLADDEQDAKYYFELNYSNRAFRNPILKTAVNKVPLFANEHECRLNSELFSPENQELVRANTEFFLANQDKVIKLLEILKKYQYPETQLKLNDFSFAPEWLYKQVEEPETPPEQQEILEKFAEQLRPQRTSFERVKANKADTVFFPETQLLNCITYIMGDGKFLWGKEYTDVMSRVYSEYYSGTANITVNNLLLMFLGNNNPAILKQMGRAHYNEFLNICSERLEFAWEEFNNELKRERRDFLLTPEAERDYSRIEKIKHVQSTSAEFYQLMRNFLDQEYANFNADELKK